MRSLSVTALDGSTSERLVSKSFPASQLNQVSVSVQVTGTQSFIGTVFVETSQEVGDTFPITLYQPQTWNPLRGASVIISGNGSFSIPTLGFAAQWIRLVFEPAVADAGHVTATLGVFGSSVSGTSAGNFISQTVNNNYYGGGTSTFTATALEQVAVGSFVARDSTGSGVIRADASSSARMPAVGIVTQASGDTVTVQSHGAYSGDFVATDAKILFVGLDGRVAESVGPLSFVQSVGSWGGPSTLVLSVSPQMLVKSPVSAS